MHIFKVENNKTIAHFCMKGKRKKLLRIAFLLSAVFFTAISGYSNYNRPSCDVEITSGVSCEDDNCISDVDFFDDQQLNPILEFKAVIDLRYKIPTQKCTLNFRYYSSIWQPPQSENRTI